MKFVSFFFLWIKGETGRGAEIQVQEGPQCLQSQWPPAEEEEEIPSEVEVEILTLEPEIDLAMEEVEMMEEEVAVAVAAVRRSLRRRDAGRHCQAAAGERAAREPL